MKKAIYWLLLVLICPFSWGFELKLAAPKVWPAEKGFEAKRTAEGFDCISTNNAGSAVFYTYCQVDPGRTYELTYRYRWRERTPGSAFSQQCTITFRAAGQKNSNWDVLRYPYAEPSDKFAEFRAAFTAPAGSERIQFQMLGLKDAVGIFEVRDLRLREVSDNFRIMPAAAPPVIDGRSESAAFSKAEVIGDFVVTGGNQPAAQQTEARITYDKDNLYIRVFCAEANPDKLLCKTTKFDGAVYHDDDVELFVAPEHGNILQLILNPIGTRWDGRMYIKVPGDPYSVDSAWNGSWRGAASIGSKGWTADFAVPFSDLGEAPRPGSIWRINIVRGSRTSPVEISHFNCFDGLFKNVEKFATLTFDKDSAELVRYREVIQADPLLVERKPCDPAKLPRREGRYTTFGMTGAVEAVAKSKEKESEKIQAMLGELTEAGISASLVLPWAPALVGGRGELLALIEKYHFGLILTLHNTGQDRKALENGAKYAYDKIRNSVNIADPRGQAEVVSWFDSYIRDNAWVIPHVRLIRGYDEPSNNLESVFSISHNPARKEVLAELDHEIAGRYGYGLCDMLADNSGADMPFRKIATMRWWNDRLDAAMAGGREVVKKHFPDVPFMPIVINTVSGFHANEDMVRVSDHADWVSVDPYPTATLARYSRERALYHTGFSTKMFHDMSGGKPTYVYIQAFKYNGRAPTLENMREWTAQALKNGATSINFYGGRSPEIYGESLEISKKITRMQPLALPRECPVGILFSYVDAWGHFDKGAHRTYSVYAILGEKLGADFRIIGNTMIDRNEKELASCKLLFIPAFTYVDEVTARRVIEFVRNGGTAVILDPQACMFTADGKKATALRNELIGAVPGEKLKAAKLLAGSAMGLKENTELPLAERLNMRNSGQVEAYRIAPPEGAETVARYPDGSASGFRRQVGQGTVWYFAAQPFGNSRLGVEKSPWDEFFAGLLREHRIETGKEYWNFQLQ